jgi:two-component system LytT family response regulator
MNEVVKLKVIIVDDETLAREKIREMLRRDSEVEIVAECSSGNKAIAAIQKHLPDLVFLDIQMPETDGFGVLKAVPTQKMPNIVFVTAYDQYALRAFEVYALDYLLKPFDRERFEKALKRAKEHIRKDRSSSLSHGILSLLEELKGGPRHLERLVIKHAGRVQLLKTQDIDWIEAEGNYVRIHTGKEEHLLRETIGSLESQLHPRKFMRIHRSTIVNIDRIRELQPWFHGEYRIILRDGAELMLSRSYREKLNEVLGKQV